MTWKRIIVFGFWLALLPALYAQNGNYFITNLTPDDEKIDPRSLGATQTDLGVIYFANKNGILEFDGNNWRLIPTPGSVYTILSNGKDVYAGGTFGFGVLQTNTAKTSEFKVISNKPNVFSSIKIEDQIFFCNETEVLTYSLHFNSLVQGSLPAGGADLYTGVHSIDGKPHVTLAESGLHRISSGVLTTPSFNLADSLAMIFSLPSTDNKQAIIGTEGGKIFRYQNGKIAPITLSDAEYIEHNELLNATWVSEDLMALGTLKGGAIFINPKTGATKEIIDYHIGLPDNDVLSLFTDRDGGVWAAHEYGFSRITPFLPFRSYNHYPGLAGNLLSVREIDGQLFAGTSLGLYYLKTEDQYEDIVYYETVIQAPPKSKSKTTSTTTPTTTTTTTTQPTTQPEKTRKKLFGFLRGKKNEEKPTAPPTQEPVTTKPNVTQPKVTQPKATQPKVTQVKKTKKILKSRQFVYQKIDGIEGKVTQLLEVNGKTIVSGLAGVYILSNLKVEPIFQEPVRYIFHSPSLNQLLISTYDDRTISLAPINDAWRETHYVDTLRDYISYIFEDDLENIWFCGKTKVYKMELVDGAITSFTGLPINNPLYDETVGLALGNDVYVAASGRFNHYDESQHAFDPYDSLTGPKKYFASSGYFWFNDGHQWHTLSKTMKNLKLEWLGLFPNLRYLSPTTDGSGLWLVTSNNELYKFTNPTTDQIGANYPLFLRDVRGEQIRLLKEKDVSMEQSEDAVYFEFTQPNYMGFGATEFRYMVHGLTKEWSEWSSVYNEIPFPYLPTGKYQLAVQSRNVLGKVSEIELVTFEVLPHYWKRWWFYALEFAFFSGIVLISIRLGRADSRYQVVSQILSLLVVILLIQFIETGINSMVEFKSSPVVEFMIQLGITLVVFPVESKLRSLMQYVSAGKFKVGKAKASVEKSKASVGQD
jgi:hypothetical protein